MIEISLHIIDIVENSVRAGADLVVIDLSEEKEDSTLAIQILDNGRGMDEDMQRAVLDPFITTKDKKRVGLGLSMMKEAARKTGGDLTIHSIPDQGTSVEAVFHSNHIDRQPLGDLVEMMIVLLTAHPQTEFQINYHGEREEFSWHSSRIEEEVRSTPAVIKFVRRELNDLRKIQID